MFCLMVTDKSTREKKEIIVSINGCFEHGFITIRLSQRDRFEGYPAFL